MTLTDDQIERRIQHYANGDSNDEEIDGLLEIIRELQAERHPDPPTSVPRHASLHSFLRSALFPLIVITLLVYVASQLYGSYG